MRRRPLRGKRFAPRMSDEELTKKISENFQTLGGGNYIQAKILYELKLFLMKRPNQKLTCMNSCIKDRKAKAWSISYTLVLEFLRIYHMRTTLQTFEIEKERKRIQPDTSVLQGMTPSRYMMGLMKTAKRKLRFRTRVEEYTRQIEKAKHSPPRVSLNFDFEVVRAGTRKKLQSESEMETKDRLSLTESFADDEVTGHNQSFSDSFVSE